MTPTAIGRQRGLTLVELMVALVLGLVVVGAVTNLFLTNRQTYRTTENLARLQENLRFAFELMARDLREAGANACGAGTVANVLNGTPSTWNWQADSLRAYASCATTPAPAPSNCAAGSPVLLINKASDSSGEVTVTDHDLETAAMKISRAGSLKTGDILFVCKGDKAAIFQATNVNASSLTVDHQKNQTQCLDFPINKNQCITSFKGGALVKLERILWYLGNNARGSTSLYRKVGEDDAVEMIPDIDALDFSFLSANGTAYQTLAAVSNWQRVSAVRVMVTSRSAEAVGTDGQPLRRTHRFTVALRNRLN